MNESTLIKLMIGREVSTLYPPSEASPSEVACQCVELAAKNPAFTMLTLISAPGRSLVSPGLAGIHPQKVTFAVFVLMGALTVLAVLLNAVRFPDVDPKAGPGLELKAIAAAVVGGVAISGGRGYLWDVAAGVLLLSSIALPWSSCICSLNGRKHCKV